MLSSNYIEILRVAMRSHMSRYSWNPKIFALALLLSGVCLHSPVGYAYAIYTHTALTEKAAERSNLGKGVLADLGIGSLNSKILGQSVTDWMKVGADFEDSTFPFWASSGSWVRYRHHFYNPLSGEGYSYGLQLGHPSPSWGLEDRGDYAEQKFSLKDGYGWMLLALTLPTKAERDENFSKLFQTLGHTVHLVQDAAQPQHTRNDSHALGSLYEDYSNQAAKDNNLPFEGYPVVSFPTARDFFHTLPPGASNVLQGKGIAEYSNRGFVTTDTNFTGSLSGGSSEFPISTFINNPSFPTPNGNGVIISTLNIHDSSLLGNTKLNLQGDISFVGTNVVDTYLGGTQPNPRTSSYSVFDADLEKYNVGGAKFTYNRFNAKEAHKFLIPRAVSYSAGLINWFFRGKIDMVKDPDNASQYLIKNLGTEPLQGTFTLYYDDTSDVRKTVTGAQWDTASSTPDNLLAAGATITVPAFTPPTDAKAANTYMLVFKGKIGVDIGNPAATDSLAAKTITDMRIKQIAAGGNHTCVLFANGIVNCWGANYFGQLGNGSTVSSTTPVKVIGIQSATAIAAGGYHTCAALADGAVKCWGSAGHGELGNGVSGVNSSGLPIYFTTPVTVTGISNATAISAGGLSEGHTCARLVDGTAKCWGANTAGQLGNGGDGYDTTSGTFVSTSSAIPVSVLNINSAIAVFAGGQHTCALLSSGQLTCWGWNGFGQLGNGTSGYFNVSQASWEPPSWSAVPVDVLGISNVTIVAVGGMHTCAVIIDGTVTCWGLNFYGQLGNGMAGYDAAGNHSYSAAPVAVLGISDAKTVATGWWRTCAIVSDDMPKCWGHASLGNGVADHSPIPVTVTNISNASEMAVGFSHTCTTLADGAVQCWGSNNSGQLGDGTTTDSSVPVAVIGLSASP